MTKFVLILQNAVFAIEIGFLILYNIYMVINTCKTIKILVMIIVMCLVACLTIVIISLICQKSVSAQSVYQNALASVVELKCESASVGESFGTAEIIDSDGMIVTNAHVVTHKKLGVVKQFESYFIRFAQEKNYRKAELLKFDIEQDIALLKIAERDGLKIKPIVVASSKSLVAGDTVYAVGNGMNFGISITQGIVSIPLVEIEYDEKKRAVIQCDVNINEGNSGGALLDNNGRLIGITTFRIRDKLGSPIVGVAYCIPIEVVIEFIKATKRK